MDHSPWDFLHPRGWPSSPGESLLFPGSSTCPPPHPHPPPASRELLVLVPGFPSDETWLPAYLPKPLAAHTLSSGEPQIQECPQTPLPFCLGSRPGTLAHGRRRPTMGYRK